MKHVNACKRSLLTLPYYQNQEQLLDNTNIMSNTNTLDKHLDNNKKDIRWSKKDK